MTDAVHYGYQLPPDDAIRKELLSNNGVGTTAAWQAKFLACGQVPQAKAIRVTSPEGPSTQQIAEQSYDASVDGTSGASIWKKWANCMQSQDVAPPKSSEWIDGGWMRADLETQVRIAVVDVKCKQSLNTVQQLADAEASAQQQLIDLHETELAEQRTALEGHLAAAKQVIAAHGG